MVAPLSLCVLRLLFYLRDFGFHGFYQLCELFLAFLSCLGVLFANGTAEMIHNVVFKKLNNTLRLLAFMSFP